MDAAACCMPCPYKAHQSSRDTASGTVQVARTSLLPSALKTLASNKDAPLPLRLFEVSDVILLDTQTAVGARNERRLIAVQAAREAGFEVLHGLLNRVMDVLGVPLEAALGGPRPDAKERPRCAACACTWFLCCWALCGVQALSSCLVDHGARQRVTAIACVLLLRSMPHALCCATDTHLACFRHSRYCAGVQVQLAARRPTRVLPWALS